MAHPFKFEFEGEVEATPEEVWNAIATGPGIDSWFMGRNEVEPGEGGTVQTELPGVGFEATITAWDPPKRFATRSAEGEDGSVHAFEYLIEGRDQGTTVVRWVHSGFLGDNWEAEYDGLKEGDPVYFDKLVQYLTHFRGRTATPVNVYGPNVPDREHAWETLHRGLGLEGPVRVGDRVRLTPAGLPEMEGVIDCLSPSFLGVRTEDGLYRFIHGYEGTVVLGHHIFAEGANGPDPEKAWQSWLAGLFR
jgi:uncharacterized protein YndB with AHSA1/START domain